MVHQVVNLVPSHEIRLNLRQRRIENHEDFADNGPSSLDGGRLILEIDIQDLIYFPLTS